jgi:hypothetical protein
MNLLNRDFRQMKIAGQHTPFWGGQDGRFLHIGINSPLEQQQSVRQKAAQDQTLLVRMSKSATVQIIQNTLFLFASFIINKKAVLRSTILYP